MRTSEDKIHPVLKNQIIKTFVQTLADFHTSEDTEVFIKKFFTESELEMFSKRLAIGYWLKKGRSYSNIKTNLKVSSATIAEISKVIKTKGFDLGLKKIEAEEWANVWAKKIRKFSSKF